MAEDELREFEEKEYSEMLEDMAREINPRKTGEMTRTGLGKFIDVAVLLRRGFQQGWQFIVIIQALFVFFGLSDQVSNALAQFGLHISGYWLGVGAIGGIIFFFVFGLALLLYGGSQRTRNLIMSKQNPNPRLDFHFYRAAAKTLKGMGEKMDSMDERLDRIEKRLEEKE